MSTFEEAVQDSELIVRGGLERFHYDLKKRRLVRQAFHLPSDRSTLSVIRATGCSADRCKEIARKHVANPSSGRVYCGLITLRAGCVRCGEATISIVEGDYPEHVCIDFGVARPKNDALQSPEDVLQYNKVLEHLFTAAKYFHDPAPDQPDWKGDQLDYRLCPRCAANPPVIPPQIAS